MALQNSAHKFVQPETYLGGNVPVAVPVKPLGRRAYQSISHLPQSRLGPRDRHCEPSRAVVCAETRRDIRDEVIVTEKLDGSCVSVARIDGQIYPLIRAGYLATDSPFQQHHMFHAWATANQARFLSCLDDGERIVGEWLAMAHGTRYQLPHEPFVVFDLMADDKRLPFDHLVISASKGDMILPRLISRGASLPVKDALIEIEVSGHGAIDPVEGAVWRVQRDGEFSFIAKYVRADKADGCYLPEVTGRDPIWNWRAV